MSLRYLKLILTLAVLILISSFFILKDSYTEDSLRICIAWSAKIAAFLFSIAFGISSFQYFFKDAYSRKGLAIRPQIGLSFAVFHTAHLIFLLILQSDFHPVFDLAKRTSLLGGGMAYFFMYLMALTTFPKFKNSISSQNWNLLHTIGGYWIWLIFFRSYFKNVMVRGEEHFMFAVLSLVIILRVSRIIHKAYKRTN